SRESTIRPAHTASAGMPSRSASRSGVRKPDESSSLSTVVDSPPGSTMPSTPASWPGVFTSDALAPNASRVSTCSRNAPCSARTPIFTRRLPTALGELHLELSDLLARHRLAETARHLRDDVGVGVVRGGLDDRARPLRRIGRLEDAAADEHRLRAELHHERGVGRRRDAARAEQRYGELAPLGDFLHELER